MSRREDYLRGSGRGAGQGYSPSPSPSPSSAYAGHSGGYGYPSYGYTGYSQSQGQSQGYGGYGYGEAAGYGAQSYGGYSSSGGGSGYSTGHSQPPSQTQASTRPQTQSQPHSQPQMTSQAPPQPQGGDQYAFYSQSQPSSQSTAPTHDSFHGDSGFSQAGIPSWQNEPAAVSQPLSSWEDIREPPSSRRHAPAGLPPGAQIIDNSKQHVIVVCNRLGITPVVSYRADGPDHAKVFTAHISLKIPPCRKVPSGADLMEAATSRNKKDAEKNAFDLIFRRLQSMDFIKNPNLVLSSSLPAAAAPSSSSSNPSASHAPSGESASMVAPRKKEVREYCERHFRMVPEPTFEVAGPDHMPVFVASLEAGPYFAVAEARTKKDAEKLVFVQVYDQIRGVIPPQPKPAGHGLRRTSQQEAAPQYPTPGGRSQLGGYERGWNDYGSDFGSRGGPSRGFGSGSGSGSKRNWEDTVGRDFQKVYSQILDPDFTERSKKFLTFYCDHFELGQFEAVDKKSPPGTPSKNLTLITIPGNSRLPPLKVMGEGISKAESQGHAFNHLYDLLRKRHPELVEMFNSIMMINPHGLENLVEIKFTEEQRHSLNHLIEEMQDYTHTPRPKPATYEKRSFWDRSQPSTQKDVALLNRLRDRERRPPPARSEANLLPITPYREKIVEAIEANSVVVIAAETGSGKTTQVAQFILDAWTEKNQGSHCNIVVTQPRRISAMTVAQRVAEERGEPVGYSVGYNVRFESRLPEPNGSVLFCTSGVLLRMLQTSPTIPHASHIILDEVHERDLNNDFLMILLKRLLKQRPDLRLILMSATVQQELFASYFDFCPIITVPGKMFHVEEYYREDIELYLRQARVEPLPLPPPPRSSRQDDFDEDSEDRHASDLVDPKNVPFHIIEALLCTIALVEGEGSVLVFLPGWEHIREMNQLLLKDRFRVGFSNPQKFRIMALHSSLSSLHQHEVFRPTPAGVRKVVLSTNIAETSVTIPDCVFVIDSVRLKEMNFDPAKRMSILDTTWCSRSSSRQRRGRAGRVRPGKYFCLVTKDVFFRLQEHQLPEMYRLDLQEICLSVKALGYPSIRAFLDEAPQRPSPANVEWSIHRLMQLQALDPRENITPLGTHLALLPVDAGLGKMLLLSVILKCLDPILTVVAASTTKDPFTATPETKIMSREIKIKFARGSNSDHLAIVNAYDEWRKCLGSPSEGYFLRENLLSGANLQQIQKTKGQLFDILVQIGFIPDDRRLGLEPFGGPVLNEHAGSPDIVAALLCAGFHPNYAEKSKKRMYRTKADKNTIIHPSSVNYKGGNNGAQASPFFVFQEKIRTARIFLLGTSQVSSLALLLFGSTLDPSPGGPRTLMMDEWIIFSCGGEDATLIAWLRNLWDRFLLNCFETPKKLFEGLLAVEVRLINVATSFLAAPQLSSQLISSSSSSSSLAGPSYSYSGHR